MADTAAEPLPPQDAPPAEQPPTEVPASTAEAAVPLQKTALVASAAARAAAAAKAARLAAAAQEKKPSPQASLQASPQRASPPPAPPGPTEGSGGGQAPPGEFLRDSPPPLPEGQVAADPLPSAPVGKLVVRDWGMPGYDTDHQTSIVQHDMPVVQGTDTLHELHEPMNVEQMHAAMGMGYDHSNPHAHMHQGPQQYVIVQQGDKNVLLESRTILQQQPNGAPQPVQVWVTPSGLTDRKQRNPVSRVTDPKEPKRGPTSRTSVYKGVTRHCRSGRWEAHVWVRDQNKHFLQPDDPDPNVKVTKGKQVYLGGYSTEEEAAEAHDVAALKCRGLKAKTNFHISRYTALLDSLDSVPMNELVMAIRRQSQAFTRGSSAFRGVTQHKNGQGGGVVSGRWEVRIGLKGSKHVYLGLHASEVEAARVYDRALVLLQGASAATNFPVSQYAEELESYNRRQQAGEKLPGFLENGEYCERSFEAWLRESAVQPQRMNRDPFMGHPPRGRGPHEDMGYAEGYAVAPNPYTTDAGAYGGHHMIRDEHDPEYRVKPRQMAKKPRVTKRKRSSEASQHDFNDSYNPIGMSPLSGQYPDIEPLFRVHHAPPVRAVDRTDIENGVDMGPSIKPEEGFFPNTIAGHTDLQFPPPPVGAPVQIPQGPKKIRRRRTAAGDSAAGASSQSPQKVHQGIIYPPVQPQLVQQQQVAWSPDPKTAGAPQMVVWLSALFALGHLLQGILLVPQRIKQETI